jgi:sugar phosphate isomerase/epimerase
MRNIPIALQLYSVRKQLDVDFEGTLKAVKEIGYDGVEFGGGLYGRSAQEVKALCEELDLIPIATHIPYPDMVADESVLDTYKEIGCKYVTIPGFTPEYRPGTDAYPEVVNNVNNLIEKINQRGMKLSYHNHDFEFQKIGDEYMLDYLYRTIPGLMAQIDTCWVNVGGESPVKYIRKYEGRQEILHLKDSFGNRTKDENDTFEYRPVGHGVLDFKEILQAADEVGVKWVIVEQDYPSLDKTMLECVKMSFEHLKSIM